MNRIFTGPTRIGKELAKIKKKRPERGIHGPMHALAKEISEYAGEPKKFAMYLGIIKNIGLRRAYKIFSEIKQNKKIKSPGKLFVYQSTFKKKKMDPVRSSPNGLKIQKS